MRSLCLTAIAAGVYFSIRKKSQEISFAKRPKKKRLGIRVAIDFDAQNKSDREMSSSFTGS
jgi:hypothetical protein